MSLFTSIGKAIDSLAYNRAVQPRDINSQRKASTLCSATRLLSLAGIIASIALTAFAIFAVESMLGMSLLLCFSVVLIVVCYDAYVTAKKVQMVLDGVCGEQKMRIPFNNYSVVAYITEGTLLLRPILQLALRNKKN